MPASNPAPLPDADKDSGVAASRRGSRRLVSIAAAFAIAIALLSFGITAPFDKDAESQSAQWVVDIAHHGNWLLPLDYYGLVERKPPLFYWLGAVAVKLTGGQVDEARARMPSLFAGAAVSALVMDWAAADLGAAGGWIAFFFLIGMYGFAARATVALTDMLMTFFLMAEWRVIRAQLDGAVSWPRTISAGLILGLGILVKGPVIVVLIALATVVYLALCRENPLRLAIRGWPWAWFAIAIGVAAMWYVPAFVAGRANNWGGVFADENFGHFLPAGMGGTGEAARPVYYIVMRLIGGTMPLAFLLPALVIAFAESAFAPSVRRAMIYQIAPVIAVVALFSSSSAKRDDYILPAIPPLAMIFAALFSGAIAAPANLGAAGDADRSKRYVTDVSLTRRLTKVMIVRDLTALAIAAAMFLGIVATICFARTGGSVDSLGPHLKSSDASFAAIFLNGMTHLRPRFVAFATAVVIGATVVFSGFARRAPVRTGTGLAILCLAGSTLWTGVLKPQVEITRSLGPFASAVKERVGVAPIYVAFMDPEFAWYYGRGVPPLPRTVAQSGLDPGGAPVYFVAHPSELMRLADPVRDALVLILPSTVLGGNPPSLYMLEAPEDLPTQPPKHRRPHPARAGGRAPSPQSPHLIAVVPSVK